MTNSGESLEAIELVPARLRQLRANHDRVPPLILGWGLSMRSIKLGSMYWIFGSARSPDEEFYWMHTNDVIELHAGNEDAVVFQTASGSLYRVEYTGFKCDYFPTPYQERLMIEIVRAARKLFEDRPNRRH